MKKLIIIYLFAILLSACSKEEVLLPSKIDFFRFEFPQGADDLDRVIDSIYKEHKVQIIYKEITSDDWNRTWKGSGLSINSDNGSIIVRETTQVYSSKDTLGKIVDYLNTVFFSKIPKKQSERILKPYMYILNTAGTETTYITSGGTFKAKSLIPFKKDGQDFWIFNPDSLIFLGKNSTGSLQYSKRIIFAYLLEAVVRGHLSEPKGFRESFNYETPIDNVPSSPNYYRTRGFVPYNKDSDVFEAIDPVFVSAPSLMTISYLPKFNMRNRVFLHYIQNAIFFTESAFEKQYGQYPIIMENYKLVMKQIKESIDIDLNLFTSL